MTATLEHLTQFTIAAPHPGYWRVTFENPPTNLMNAVTAAALQQIVTAAERADGLRVVVFDSANPDFYFARHDFSGGGNEFALACDMRFAIPDPEAAR